MIEIDSVSVSLGGVDVLEEVTLDVDTGEFVGLVGPNGSGKTTLLRTVNGALRPESGAVHVDGDEMATLSSRAGSRRVATVPQDTSTRFAFSVEDVVAMGRTPHRDRFRNGPSPDEHVDGALARTETESLRDRRIDTLSGGERQRVFVARALAQDAPALVLDEPTASLDINHATRTLSLVRDLVDDGRAVLGAIHDLDAAARFCDQIAFLHDGSVLAMGPPEDVLTSEALATTFDTEAVVTRNPVTGSPAVTGLPAPEDGGCRVHVLGGGSIGAQVIARLSTAGHDVTAGPFIDGDEALAVTRQLDVPVETVPPLDDLDGMSLTNTRDRISNAAVTVVADLAVSPSLRQIDLADAATRLVVVESRPLSERNYAGERGRTAYDRLSNRARTSSVEELSAVVTELAGEIPHPIDGRQT